MSMKILLIVCCEKIDLALLEDYFSVTYVRNPYRTKATSANCPGRRVKCQTQRALKSDKDRRLELELCQLSHVSKKCCTRS